MKSLILAVALCLSAAQAEAQNWQRRHQPWVPPIQTYNYGYIDLQWNGGRYSNYRYNASPGFYQPNPYYPPVYNPAPSWGWGNSWQMNW